MSRSRVVLATAALLAILAFLALLSPATRSDSKKSRRLKAASAQSAPSVTDGRVHDFPRRTGIRSTLPEVSAAFDPKAPPHPLAPYIDVLESVWQRLSETPVSISFTDAALAEVLADIQDQCGVPLRTNLPPESQVTVTFKVNDLAADQTLDLITRMADLAMIVDAQGEIWIVPEDDQADLRPPETAGIDRIDSARRSMEADRKQAAQEADDRKTLAGLGETRRMFGVNGAPLLDAASFFPESFGFSIVLSSDIRRDPDPSRITIPDRTMSATEALDALTAGDQFGWCVENRVVLIGLREHLDQFKHQRLVSSEALAARREALANLLAKSVSFGGTNLAVRDVADLLSRELGVPVELDTLTWRRAARFEITGDSRPASEIVAALAAAVPLQVTLHDGTLWFLAPGEAQ